MYPQGIAFSKTMFRSLVMSPVIDMSGVHITAMENGS
jgi:hypothetical protein